MNTPERNDKNVDRLQRLSQVYKDSDEDRHKEEQYKIALEEVTREYPLPTARKFVIVACIAFWLFCFGGLLFGINLRGVFPFLFIALAVLVLLHIPIFWIKKKIIDLIIGTAFAAGCIALAVSMLTGL
jgi:hypothetical protein